MNPDSVALVHMTNYFPKNGEILSTNLATKAADGVGASRTTVHFCLNKPVVEHLMGSGWNTMDYAIILMIFNFIKSISEFLASILIIICAVKYLKKH